MGTSPFGRSAAIASLVSLWMIWAQPSVADHNAGERPFAGVPVTLPVRRDPVGAGEYAVANLNGWIYVRTVSDEPVFVRIDVGTRRGDSDDPIVIEIDPAFNAIYDIAKLHDERLTIDDWTPYSVMIELDDPFDSSLGHRERMGAGASIRRTTDRECDLADTVTILPRGGFDMAVEQRIHAPSASAIDGVDPDWSGRICWHTTTGGLVVRNDTSRPLLTGWIRIEPGTVGWVPRADDAPTVGSPDTDTKRRIKLDTDPRFGFGAQYVTRGFNAGGRFASDPTDLPDYSLCTDGTCPGCSGGELDR